MPKFSVFNRFPIRFSSRPTTAEQIYKDRIASLGGEENFSTAAGSLTEAESYAEAMAMGRAKDAGYRAGQQFRPTKAVEKLPNLEWEFGLIPGPTQTIRQRQAGVEAAAKVARGARRNNVEAVLRGLLGDDFVAIVTQDPGSLVETAADPSLVGLWKKPGTKKYVYRILSAITVLGSPITVPVEYVAGDPTGMQTSDQILIDVEDWNRTEKVLVSNGTTTSFVGTFTKPHNNGTLLAAGRMPNLGSTMRHSMILLSAAAAADPEKRRIANRAARKLFRGISTWSVGAAGGPFKIGPGVGKGLLNFTPIHATP